MSDSRLEKFIYAICSMDVSDLPVPLSRIETLWNCLITGETPDFEPLSRNEKYLMAMLDRYDISNLPAPMSRGEKLLYKIAVGETDLSDVPGYLSRYEELLKYLIENGGIGGDDGGDFEYVLYTLNQSLSTLYTTAEKPVKSAILKGNTLVNISPLSGEITIKPNSIQFIDSSHIQKDKTFTFMFNCTSAPSTGFIEIRQVFGNDALKIETINVVRGYNKFKLKTVNKEVARFRLKNESTSETDFVFNNLLIIEGDYTNADIPYFEGMQSVKMPVLKTIGKNLFDINSMSNINNWDTVVSSEIPYCSYKINLKPNTTYTFNQKQFVNIENVYASFGLEKGGFEYLLAITHPNAKYPTTFKLTTDDRGLIYVKLYRADTTLESFISKLSNNQLQLEESSTATLYEPFKSNILTTNEEVTLRGIGDVKDELNCLTGEVTESIGEIVLDGTQYMDADGRGIYIQVDDMKKVEDYRAIITCDKLPVFYHQWDLPNVENGITGYLDEENKYPGQNWLYIKVNNSIDVGEVRQILTQNPITFQYQRVADSIKTVDLTVVDQDNQPTELGTFENITHVSLEAENLVPEVEMEVATNLLEDTVFNLTDAFNTLYPTAAKPVKSAILKGNTLVNISPLNGEITLAPASVQYIDSLFIKNNTTFTISFNCSSVPTTGFIEIRQVFENTALKMENKPVVQGYNRFEVTTGSSEINRFRFKNDSTSETDFIFNNLMILEGDYTNVDIPYFEGMQSVKMPVLTTTGKNLIDSTSWESGRIDNTTGEVSDDANFMRYIKYIQVKPSTTYVWKNNVSNEYKAIYEYGASKEYIGLYNNAAFLNQAVKFTTSATTNFIKIWVKNTTVSSTNQLEESASATDYEPYKSNILTVNEDIELRGIGEVQDELNVMTGELTERIGEIVLNEDITGYQDTNYSVNGYSAFRVTSITNIPNGLRNVICDKVKYYPNISLDWTKQEEFFTTNGNLLFVKILSTKASNFEELRTFLSSSPITIQYELTESIKTVDLTVVDQDNQPTQLGTFDDTTHVLLESEGLIPTAALTVRTKIPSASSTSLLMDDISNEQQQLSTTVDEQSENVDATMIATTEIFEEIL